MGHQFAYFCVLTRMKIHHLSVFLSFLSCFSSAQKFFSISTGMLLNLLFVCVLTVTFALRVDAFSSASMRLQTGGRAGSIESISAKGHPNLTTRGSLQMVAKSSYPTVVIPKSYNVAAGFLVTSALVALGGDNYVAGGIIGLIALFIARQTGKVRFVFDEDSMEVLISKSGGSDEENAEEMEQSRENFAVGGRNRWTYDSFTDWFFIPSRQFPVLMYFTERQTDPSKDQLHLFPVIMDSQVLNDALTERVGPSSKQ